MSNLDRLRAAFRQSLDLTAEYDVDVLEYRGIDKWDSLAHMSLVAEIEDVFDVMIDTEDVIDMSSFTKAREILEKNGVVFG
ncbi:acyl carrier protein [Longispora fulva]|uniref:Acyl carrier protein n=1 Tax=Longispora fulva TaxID=619741 RepID=A0A8J7GMD1_9ACTN|nr:acyl carrier protein [Longispora fulva]MBG6140966.1 acyl carrier protein [Longispora fulva]GIG60768.1 acyl carrier protein [Longispora fulva]